MPTEHLKCHLCGRSRGFPARWKETAFLSLHSAMAFASASTPSAPPLYPCLSDEEAAAAEEPLVGYPAIPVDGQPVYGYPPSLPYHRRRRRCCRCTRFFARTCACLCFLFVVLIAIAAFFVWPRSLDMNVDDISLGKIHFSVKREGSIIPNVYLNLTLDLKLEAQNFNYFDVTYKTVIVSIHYEDDEIGEAESHGGDIEARSTSSVDASLELNSNEIASNVLSLLSDVASGAVPVQTVVTFDGHMNVFWFKIPLEADVTCNLVIDPDDQVVCFIMAESALHLWSFDRNSAHDLGINFMC